MQRVVLAAVSVLLAAGAAQAREVHTSCNIDSRYELGTDGNAFVFTLADGHPSRVLMSAGRLQVDGRDAPLSPADQTRVRDFEVELRQLLPEAQKVASAAVGIAFDALGEVARALASDPKRAVANLERSRAIALREIRYRPEFMFSHDDKAIEDAIEPIVTRFVPDIIGGAVSLAVHAIFASDAERDAMEARMDKMGRTLDHEIQGRAGALEPMADAICLRMKRMDAIDNALDYRLPGGSRLELLSVDKAEIVHVP